MPDIDHILRKNWGYTNFRPLQREIIESVLSGRDTIALLPTGGGKSITYQIPALAMEGVTIVVTPLIALMRDQVLALRKLGINAVAINSAMNFREIDVALDNCVYGDVKMLYIAPERIDTLVFRTRIKRMNVCLVAVDEAHCISQWGYDFRPSYLRIGALRKELPDVPFMALTATATSVVLSDISKFLALEEPRIFRASFARPNIRFIVRGGENKLEQILRVANGVRTGSGIVYCRTRNDTQVVADFLNARGVSADFYHAGLGFKMRSLKQQEWMQNKTRVMVATNAFGMGIDKGDVRFVVHYAIPDSIEAYYQEAGRAGRDGQEAYAVLLYNDMDRTSTYRRIEMEYPPINVIKDVYFALFNYLDVSIDAGKGEVYEFNLEEFSYRFKFFPLTAYNALKILELDSYFTLTEQMEHPTRIMMSVQRDALYRVQVGNADLDNFIKIILRSYTGLFSDFIAIDETYLARISGYTETRVVEFLLALSRLHIMKYIPRRSTPLIFLEHDRLPQRDVVISPENYARRMGQSQLRAAAIVEYAAQGTQCRSVVLREYFDELSAEPCGVCDVCTERQKRGQAFYDATGAYQAMEQLILSKLSSGEQYDLRTLVASLSGPSATALNIIRRLIANGNIEQLSSGAVIFRSGI